MDREKESGRERETRREGDPSDLPEVTFSTFVLSINTSALVHLGVLPDPATGEKREDKALARHAIDTLAMLQEKTRGNLSQEEQGLLDSILYDLRMRFIGLDPV